MKRAKRNATARTMSLWDVPVDGSGMESSPTQDSVIPATTLVTPELEGEVQFVDVTESPTPAPVMMPPVVTSGHGPRQDAGERIEGARKFLYSGFSKSDRKLSYTAAKQALLGADDAPQGIEAWWNWLDRQRNWADDSQAGPVDDLAFARGKPELISLNEITGNSRGEFIAKVQAECQHQESKELAKLLLQRMPWSTHELQSVAYTSDGRYVGWQAPDPAYAVTFPFGAIILASKIFEVDSRLENERPEDIELGTFSLTTISRNDGTLAPIPGGIYRRNQVLQELTAQFKRSGEPLDKSKWAIAVENAEDLPLLEWAKLVGPDRPMRGQCRNNKWTVKYRPLNTRRDAWHREILDIAAKRTMPLLATGGAGDMESHDVVLTMADVIEYQRIKAAEKPESSVKASVETEGENVEAKPRGLAAIIEAVSTPGPTKALIQGLDKPIRTQDGVMTEIGREPITEEAILEKFGLRGIQYGNWVTQEEREQVLRLLDYALSDMATVLDVDSKAIGIPVDGIGGLAISFGARGKGTALAHYEPDRHVINLTRKKGGGSLGHEYAHALDRFLVTRGYASDVPDTPIAEWVARLERTQNTETKEVQLAILRDQLFAQSTVRELVMACAMREPQHFGDELSFKDPDGEDVVVPVAQAIKVRSLYREMGLDKWNSDDKVLDADVVRGYLNRTLELCATNDELRKTVFESPKGKLFRQVYKDMENYGVSQEDVALLQVVLPIALSGWRHPYHQAAWSKLAKASGVRYENRAYTAGKSRFFKVAVDCDHGKIARSNDDGTAYWTRPTERFARAFQGVVFEELNAKGIENEMLTATGEAERSPSMREFAGLTTSERVEEALYYREHVRPALRNAILERFVPAETNAVTEAGEIRERVGNEGHVVYGS